jgi:hypothetical protein
MKVVVLCPELRPTIVARSPRFVPHAVIMALRRSTSHWKLDGCLVPTSIQHVLTWTVLAIRGLRRRLRTCSGSQPRTCANMSMLHCLVLVPIVAVYGGHAIYDAPRFARGVEWANFCSGSKNVGTSSAADAAAPRREAAHLA